MTDRVPADVVRAATPHDAGAVGRMLFDVNTEFEESTPSPEFLSSRFRVLVDRDDVLVLLSGERGRESGFAFVTLRPTPYRHGPVALLEELSVVPDRRGGGLGTALLLAAIDHVRERGSAEMQINVDEEDVDARRFYERHGFHTTAPGSDSMMLFYERPL